MGMGVRGRVFCCRMCGWAGLHRVSRTLFSLALCRMPGRGVTHDRAPLSRRRLLVPLALWLVSWVRAGVWSRRCAWGGCLALLPCRWVQV